jgi:putative hemolysin
VFRLGDWAVGVLMTPRKMIDWIDINDSPEKMRETILKSSYSRLPVCQGRLGNIHGVVHVKDLLAQSLLRQAFDLKACLKQPLYVHENMHVLKVMELFKETGTQMALVIDEYGTIEGLVTLNDFLEAIVGDFSSEDASDEPRIVEREDGSYLMDGMLPADELKEMFEIKSLPEEKAGLYHTLGGLVMTYLKRIPTAGDHFECSGLYFEVMDMDGHRVDKVLVKRLDIEKENGESHE